MFPGTKEVVMDMNEVQVVRAANYDEAAVIEHGTKARALQVSDVETGRTPRRTYSPEFKLLAIEAHGMWAALGGFKHRCEQACVPHGTARDWCERPNRPRAEEDRMREGGGSRTASPESTYHDPLEAVADAPHSVRHTDSPDPEPEPEPSPIPTLTTDLGIDWDNLVEPEPEHEAATDAARSTPPTRPSKSAVLEECLDPITLAPVNIDEPTKPRTAKPGWLMAINKPSASLKARTDPLTKSMHEFARQTVRESAADRVALLREGYDIQVVEEIERLRDWLTELAEGIKPLVVSCGSTDLEAAEQTEPVA